MRGEKWRFWLPVALMAAFGAYCSAKLVLAHVNPKVSSLDYTFSKDIPARRGNIYDCYGKAYPLVKSVPYWEYHLDPVSLTNRVVRRRGEPVRPKEAIVKTIADSLGLKYGIVKRMSSDASKRYQFLAKSSDPEAHRILADSKLVSGIAIEDRQVRQYLHGRRLCHVLGSVNAEYVGSAGVELRYNSDLSGVPGRIKGMKDAHGHELYDKRIVSIDPIPGSDIYLTIDHNIQFEAEKSLLDGIREFGAGSGWCVILDAHTAAVLAMVSYPDFDPTQFGKTPEWAKMNRVTNFTYEPGSAMKVITAAAAINTGRYSPNTMYRTNRDDSRYYRLPGDGSHKWEPLMSIADAVVHSSNIVIGKLGCDLGPETLWGYMKKFGFGEKTGIELPGEEVGILPHWKKWDKVKHSRAPIGQGVSVTAIQLAGAYQTIANNGLRMRPYIIQKIVEANGNESYRHEPVALGRPISDTTARQMRRLMQGVASKEGTARRAAIRGYTVAGKTGTAQKVINGKYSDSLYRATFCGIVPAMDPRIVVLVTLDFDQRAKYHQGGNSAAPIFRKIATSALRYLMVPPDKPEELEDYVEEEE